MNPFQSAVVARLKAAGLLQTAERTAHRVELRLADCIAPGEVTGGHRALWAALAKTVPPAHVATLVGFPETTVRAELPAPESGDCLAGLPADDPSLVGLAASIAAAQDRVEKLRRAAARVLEEADAVAADLRSLQGALDGASVAASQNARAIAVAHLYGTGDTERVVEGVCAAHRVPPERLLMGARDQETTTARRAAVAAMTERGWSQHRIAVLLKIDHFAVLRHQRVAGVRPTRAPRSAGRKAAA